VRRLYYAGGNFLIDDRVCKTVMRYARALAIADKSDLIMLPVVTEEGSLGSAHLLVGPASEIYSLPVSNDSASAFDAEAVRKLEQMTAELQDVRPAWESELTDVPDIEDL
jgi:hypothetical protein